MGSFINTVRRTLRINTVRRTLRTSYRKSCDLLRITRRMLFYRHLGIDERRLLFIACFPKSGSTYLMRLLCDVTGFPRVILVQFMGPNEQDLYERKLDRFRYRDGVCQQHLKGTLYNIKLVKKHRIRIVVLVRNIFDTVLSLCDHFDSKESDQPTGYTPRQFYQMSEEEKWTFLIRVHIPWYFNFLMSWYEVKEDVPVFWISYEELFENQVGVVSELLQFWNMPVDEQKILQGIESVKTSYTRFNKGIHGRGEKLSEQQKNAIRELADVCKLDPSLRKKIGL